MSLLEDLGRLADTLPPSDVAASHTTERLIGALIKVLEHHGITVADELFPATPDPAAGRPAEEKAANALEQLLARVEHAVSKLEGHSDAPSVPAAP